MAIRKKDGSIYRVSSPNKLMIGQNFWNTEQIIYHNLHNYASDNEIILNNCPIAPITSPKKQIKQDVYIDPNKFLNEIETLRKSEETVIIKPEPTPEVASTTQVTVSQSTPTPQDNKPKSIFRTLQRTMLFCLPAKVSQFKDSLYGDEVTRVTYDSPFKFQAAFIDRSSVKCAIWTTIPHITRLSIIFDSDHRQWWKIVEMNKDVNGDGIVMIGVPSTITPDFSPFLKKES